MKVLKNMLQYFTPVRTRLELCHKIAICEQYNRYFNLFNRYTSSYFEI